MSSGPLGFTKSVFWHTLLPAAAGYYFLLEAGYYLLLVAGHYFLLVAGHYLLLVAGHYLLPAAGHYLLLVAASLMDLTQSMPNPTNLPSVSLQLTSQPQMFFFKRL